MMAISSIFLGGDGGVKSKIIFVPIDSGVLVDDIKNPDCLMDAESPSYRLISD